QVDTPLHLYDHPANLFVAGFIGSTAMNLLEGKFNDAGADISGHTLAARVSAVEKSQHSGSITVGVRPESFKVSENGQGVPVKVTVVEELGADAYLFALFDDGAATDAITAGTNVVVRVEARRHFEKGSTV